MNADGGELAQITTTRIARRPVCSADSQEVKFSVPDGSGNSVWSIPVAGGTPKELLPPESGAANFAISRDGKLASSQVASQLTYHLEAFDLVSRPLTFEGSMDNSDGVSGAPLHFSPDGGALVYSVRRDGGITLLSQPIDGTPPIRSSIPGRQSDF
jgi:Tol biopolymer transport system component